MPLHRHECESCGHRFRILVTHGTEDDPPTCPACGGLSTRRLMPLVAVQFKGSGFYRTDHGRKSGSRPDKAGEGSESRDSGEKKPADGLRTTSDSEPSADSGARDKSKNPSSSAE